jgi:uncharacterized protein (TIGR02996 family)
MSSHEAFLQAIREVPQDEGPRLVYADWLEENGDADRAAFIRAQCRFASWKGPSPERAVFRREAEELLRRHWEEWVGPVRGVLGKKADRHGEQVLLGPFGAGSLDRFHGGFIERLSLDVGDLVRQEATLARYVPLVDLCLWGAGGGKTPWTESTYLRGVSRLWFGDYFVEPLVLLR